MTCDRLPLGRPVSWDNSKLTAQMNADKDKHQADVPNLNTAIAHEFRGLIDALCTAHEYKMPPDYRVGYALTAMHHWHENPRSQAFVATRVFVSLHGLHRFDPQRRYQDGDLTDIMVAASALPYAAAFYTDRKLFNLLNDPRVAALRSALPCEPVAGFANMARHLAKLIDR